MSTDSKAVASRRNGRYEWLDMMKVIGMYFIIVGHMFPIAATTIYAFSVPLFFVLSGFLSKREDTDTIFWKKLWKGLVVPMIFICFILMGIDCVSDWDKYGGLHMIERILCLLSGSWGGVNSPGLNICWFIYTLCILRIMRQYIPVKLLFWVILPLFSILAIYLNTNGITLKNAWANCMVSYPFFLFGIWIKEYKDLLLRVPNKILVFISIVLLAPLLYFISIKNGAPWMYKNLYGNNLFLFLIGGVLGTLIIYLISINLSSHKAFERYRHIVTILAQGNILVLGFHLVLVNIYKTLAIDVPLIEYVIGICIYAIFYPIILMAKYYFPWALGISNNKIPKSTIPSNRN